MRIAELAQDRNNNFNLIRFLAATAVLFAHSYALSGHPMEEPLLRWSNGATHFGTLGVTLFFIISGFLVSKSFTERRTLAAFSVARALRIYPALIAATLFSAALAGALSTTAWRDFLIDSQTHRFVVANSIGWHARYYLPGAFADNPFPRAVNGSLWTIPVELRMYVGCAIVGALTLFSAHAVQRCVDRRRYGLRVAVGLVRSCVGLVGRAATRICVRARIVCVGESRLDSALTLGRRDRAAPACDQSG